MSKSILKIPFLTLLLISPCFVFAQKNKKSVEDDGIYFTKKDRLEARELALAQQQDQYYTNYENPDSYANTNSRVYYRRNNRNNPYNFNGYYGYGMGPSMSFYNPYYNPYAFNPYHQNPYFGSPYYYDPHFQNYGWGGGYSGYGGYGAYNPYYGYNPYGYNPYYNNFNNNWAWGNPNNNGFNNNNNNNGFNNNNSWKAQANSGVKHARPGRSTPAVVGAQGSTGNGRIVTSIPDGSTRAGYYNANVYRPSVITASNGRSTTGSSANTIGTSSRPVNNTNSGTIRPNTGTSSGTIRPNTGTSSGTIKPNTGSSSGTVRPNTGGSSGTIRPSTGGSSGTIKPSTGGSSGTIRPSTGGGTRPR